MLSGPVSHRSDSLSGVTTHSQAINYGSQDMTTMGRRRTQGGILGFNRRDPRLGFPWPALHRTASLQPCPLLWQQPAERLPRTEAEVDCVAGHTRI